MLFCLYKSISHSPVPVADAAVEVSSSPVADDSWFGFVDDTDVGAALFVPVSLLDITPPADPALASIAGFLDVERCLQLNHHLG